MKGFCLWEDLSCFPFVEGAERTGRKGFECPQNPRCDYGLQPTQCYIMAVYALQHFADMCADAVVL